MDENRALMWRTSQENPIIQMVAREIQNFDANSATTRAQAKLLKFLKASNSLFCVFFSSKSFLIYNLCRLLTIRLIRYLGSTFCQLSDVLMQSTFVCIHFVCVQLICLLHNSMNANVGDSLILNTIINYHKLCLSIFLQSME